MLTKEQIATFMNRVTVDRSLRIDKTMLLEICEQAMNAVDRPTHVGYDTLEEAIAAFEEETGFILPRVTASLTWIPPEAPPLDEADLGEMANNEREMSLEEMLDSPLTDVPTNGTVVAGGNPPCDTKTQKSTPPSSPKAKTTHK